MRHDKFIRDVVPSSRSIGIKLFSRSRNKAVFGFMSGIRRASLATHAHGASRERFAFFHESGRTWIVADANVRRNIIMRFRTVEQWLAIRRGYKLARGGYFFTKNATHWQMTGIRSVETKVH